MSGDSFLSRWAQRKAEVRKAEAEPAEPTVAVDAAPEAELDLTTLPPIETLTESSDFTVFLGKGVPEAMRQAALRKLWVTDPSVRDYKPLVEYNWDFTAPGYGDLLPTDDIKKFVQHILPDEPRPDAEAAPETVAEADATPPAGMAEQLAIEPPTGTGSLRVEALPDADIIVQASPLPEPQDQPQALSEAAPRRRHGGALPD